VTFEVIIMPQ